MAAFDATEVLVPYRDERGYGAILFDQERLRQAEAAWMDPGHWGPRARQVDSGGRGGAWFIDAPFGASVLRQYRRGGLAANLSHDRYLWRGADRTRSFAEFRLTRALHRLSLPVPQPYVASYLRQGLTYRAAILMQRLAQVRSLAQCYADEQGEPPLEETGRLIARFHRAGLDHADLNAHNILFDPQGRGWLIDFDRGVLRIPATRWRQANLDRLLRSLMKLRGARDPAQVDADFKRLRGAYERAWERGF